MTHLAIMSWSDDRRIEKVAEFATEAEAIAHRTTHLARWPDAFVCERPSGYNETTWKVNATFDGVEFTQALADELAAPALAALARSQTIAAMETEASELEESAEVEDQIAALKLRLKIATGDLT